MTTISRPLGATIAALGLFLAVLVAPATSAYAAGTPSLSAGQSGGGSSGSAPGGGSGSSASGNTNKGGAGQSGPTWGTSINNGPAGSHWVTYSGTGDAGGACPEQSDGRIAQGWTRSVLQNSDNDALAAGATPRMTCHYAPPSVVSDYTITCPVRITGTIVGPRGTGVTQPSKTWADLNLLSAWAKGGQTATSCGSHSANLSSSVEGAGVHDLDLTLTSRACRVRSYSGTQAERLMSCGREVGNNVQKSLSVHCSFPNGWVDGERTPTGGFGNNTCRTDTPSSGVTWSCSIADVTYDGKRGPGLSILDDGKHRLAQWDAHQIRNVRNIHGQQTHWTVDQNSTPLRANTSLNANTQPMVLSPTQGGQSIGLDAQRGGEVTGVYIAWLDAGNPGKPSITHRKMTFQGQFPQPIINLGSIDLTTGQVTSSGAPGTAWVDGSGTCTSRDLVVDSFRARISN